MSIQRHDVGDRMSHAVVHNGVAYLSGQVAFDKAGASVAEQTQNILDRIDKYLAAAGTDKSKLLAAEIWLTDMDTYTEMNGVWDAWVSPGNTPARACVEARLAAPEYTVEIMVTAAV